MINRATLNKTLRLKVRVYQYTILYEKNCTISIRDEELNEEMVINKGNIAFFQRNINIRITMIKNGECEPYEIHTLTNDALVKLVKILEQVMSLPVEINSENRSLYHKIFSVDGTDYHKFIFETVKKLKNDNATIYALACLFIQVKQTNEIYSSLCISASRYFSDSIRNIDLATQKSFLHAAHSAFLQLSAKHAALLHSIAAYAYCLALSALAANSE